VLLLLETFSELLFGSVAATEDELTLCDWMKTDHLSFRRSDSVCLSAGLISGLILMCFGR